MIKSNSRIWLITYMETCTNKVSKIVVSGKIVMVLKLWYYCYVGSLFTTSPLSLRDLKHYCLRKLNVEIRKIIITFLRYY